LAETDAIFTADEATMLRAVAHSLRLEYGELDVLRDRDDGQVYVVDANPTPWGPPRPLSAHDEAAAMQRMSAAFERFVKQLLEQARPRGRG
jgi:hypothetical protein